ncbi:MAG: palmitoyltransferase akr1 [Candelina mexicana]|nr:MAG: palmitoyltransferase akr1 [Candelina mexicana]
MSPEQLPSKGTSGADGFTVPQGKAMAAAPKLSDEENMELKDIPAGPDLVPIEEDIMQLARMGEVGAIQKLFETGKFDAKYQDGEGITPLHWAAINNQYAVCKYLLDSGAEVNTKGGESVATPAMWAAQRCHYYIVSLLLQHGADPLLTDVQGYNVLHLATFDGNVFLLILLLHQNIPVDIPDREGHTCLMWAAYKGYPACVDLFLRWGANVNAIDENGFTALHWSLVKGSQACVQKLIEYGSDRFLETSTGKTPAITADEMKATRIWHRALAECGYDEEGNSAASYLPFASYLKNNRGVMTKFFFLWPFLIIFFVIYILSHMVVYAAVPIALVVGYSLQWVAQQALRWAPTGMKHMHRTPFLAGIFAGTLFWVGVRWLTTILPSTFGKHMFLNVIFAAFYGLCTFFYFICMLEDPGYIPKLGSRGQQKAVIDELLGLWKFDDQNFCGQCMVRKPLRSKHCKLCGRCIAKHDHHCPWVANCVGINNHRHFFLYILCLEIGVFLLIRLTLYHLGDWSNAEDAQCNIISPSLCGIILTDPFTILLVAWAGIQLTWVTMLLVVQLVQVSRAQTTFESMRGHSHSDGNSASEAITSALTAGTTSLSGAQLTDSGMGPNPTMSADAHNGHTHRDGFFSRWKKLLGLDTFVNTALHGYHGSKKQARQPKNPFSRGVITNCKDFWCDSAPIFGRRENGAARLGGGAVNYTRMYETPSRLRIRRGRGDTDEAYQSLAADDSV